MGNLVIIQATASSPEYADIFALRDEVLRKPLGMSLKDDDLSRDFVDIILAGKMDGKVIGCLMLHHKDNDRLQLRQMAVDADFQGQGIGRQLVQAAEKYAREKGYKRMILHARKTAIGFYESMDYEVFGDEFFEVGISHFLMEKEMGG